MKDPGHLRTELHKRRPGANNDTPECMYDLLNTGGGCSRNQVTYRLSQS